MFEKVMERIDYYKIGNECFKDDIKFLFEDLRKGEGKRKKEVMDILRREKRGVKGEDIGIELNIKRSNVASVILELRKGGVDIININGFYILGDYVNIGG